MQNAAARPFSAKSSSFPLKTFPHPLPNPKPPFLLIPSTSRNRTFPIQTHPHCPSSPIPQAPNSLPHLILSPPQTISQTTPPPKQKPRVKRGVPIYLKYINYTLKCAKALFASAIRCVSSFFLNAPPSPLLAATISFASFSAMLRPFLSRL